MSAPEKCPKCGAEHEETTKAGLVIYRCQSASGDGSFIQSGICTRIERDALRAQVAALEARIATMVTREVAIAACELREFFLCPECEGDGILGSTKSCHLITCENCGGDEESEGCGYVQISSEAALARAEAEAGKDGR